MSEESKCLSELGEGYVSQVLKRSFDNVIDGYVIRDEAGYTHETDHVVVTGAGVFVIETKNYSGIVLGDDDIPSWTQVLCDGKIRNKLYNPVRQNRSHAYHIRKVLPKKTNVYTLVVMVQGNIENIISDDVFSIPQAIGYINSKQEYLTREEIYDILDALDRNRVTDFDKEEHLRQIQKIKPYIKQNLCPRCKAKLVRRRGDIRDYYECSNYPRCKFNIDVDEYK
jgi:hypothetical protein